jgi:hypothetical protein
MRTRGGFALATASVFVGILFGASGATGAAAATLDSHHKASPASLANKLAGQVSKAHTPRAREKAIIAVLDALHVGVYKTSGKPVERGAERSVRDLYLYDYEVSSIADELARQQTYGLADASDLLASLGVKPGGGAVTTDQLDKLLRDGIQISAKSRKPFALLPLLIRELGKRDKPASDPLKASPDSLRLDALSYALLDISFLGEALRHENAHGSRRALAAGKAGCPEPKPDPEVSQQLGESALAWWVERKLGELEGRIGSKIAKALEIKELVEKILGGLHGSLLAYSLQVKAVNGNVATHYGPAGHASGAGGVANFQMRVTMLDDLGEQNIRCLALAGIKLPRKGPIPGVPILWELGAQGNLLQHGTTNPGGGIIPPRTSTGDDGVATLPFTPKDELVPGFGVDTHDTGVVDGIAQWQDAFDNEASLFGVKLNQYLTPKFDGVRWDVGFHNQNGTMSVVANESGNFTCPGCTGSYNLGLQSQVPITNAVGGTAPLAWTALSYHLSEPCGMQTFTRDGDTPTDGTLSIQQITNQPSLAVTVRVASPTYVLHDRGCTTADSVTKNDPFFNAVDSAHPTPGVTRVGTAGTDYLITGWTMGSGDPYATKTIGLRNDGTMTLTLHPGF